MTLDTFTFFRVVSCTTEQMDDMFEFFSEKMNEFYTATLSIRQANYLWDCPLCWDHEFDNWGV